MTITELMHKSFGAVIIRNFRLIYLSNIIQGYFTQVWLFLFLGLGDRLFAELVEKFDINHSTSDGHHRHSNSHLEFQVYPSTLHR